MVSVDREIVDPAALVTVTAAEYNYFDRCIAADRATALLPGLVLQCSAIALLKLCQGDAIVAVLMGLLLDERRRIHKHVVQHLLEIGFSTIKSTQRR
jgi:hypothetical protein